MVSYGLPKRQESDPVLLSADTDSAKLRLKCALISRRSAGRQVSETGHGHEWLSPGLVTTVASVPINFFFPETLKQRPCQTIPQLKMKTRNETVPPLIPIPTPLPPAQHPEYSQENTLAIQN